MADINDNETFSKAQKIIREKYLGNADKSALVKYKKFFNEFRQWAYWYPDKFIDLLNDNDNFILDVDQRLTMRLMIRYRYFGIQARGTGKTFIAYLVAIVLCMIFPDITVLYIAQTQQASADRLKQKHSEISRMIPFIKNEITHKKQNKEDFSIRLKNGSVLRSGVAGEGQRGDRANYLIIDERAFVPTSVINDILEPIISEPRKSLKDGKIGMHEFNSMKAISSAGYYGSSAYQTYIDSFEHMANFDGAVTVATDYKTVVMSNNRGYNKSKAKRSKDTLGKLEWEMNYESNWGGAGSEGGIVDVEDVELSRRVEEAEYKNSKDSEYVFAYDIARNWNSKKQDDSALVIGKVIRASNGDVGRLVVVNVITVNANENFEKQAKRIKVLDELFNPKVIVIDANIIGLGVMEFLMKETNGEDKIYPAYNTLNTPEEPNTDNYVNKLFALQTSRKETKQSDVVKCFINEFKSRNIDLLIPPIGNVVSAKNKDDFKEKDLPHFETSQMINELLNLQVKYNEKSDSVSISQHTRGINKDKAMALMYLVFYTFKKLDDDKDKKDIDVSKYLRMIR